MRRASLAVVVLALTGCPRPTRTESIVEPAVASEAEAARRRRLMAELQDEILTAYDRDEPPDVETLLIDPSVGPTRIGVGPGDVLFGDDVARLASSRWPLQIDSSTTPTTVRSKHLRIHLSHDRQVSAAWISDEVSWRITACNRTAVIPLRLTALFAHDGDRWVQVFEHLSFGRIPQPTADGQLRGKPIPETVVDRDLADKVTSQLNALLSGDPARVKTAVAPGPSNDDPMKPASTFLLSPAADGEWDGGSIESIHLVDGTVTPDRPRVGTIGRPDRATIAYWTGNLVADLQHHPGAPASKVLLRGSFIFEKRDGAWIVVQGHLSQPVDDIDLAQLVYGTALISDKPLQITCDDGAQPH